ncbi:MAG: hypothetical protein ACLSEX_11600 [Blautia sp.]
MPLRKLSYAENRAKTGLKIKSLFAVDTGMNRIGIDASDPEERERIIRKFYSASLVLESFYSSMCS